MGLGGWFRKLLGNRGERAAADFLRRLGYRILARQKTAALGEIDLIALDGDCVVFVEVKTRRSTDAGTPLEAVTPRKQRKITQAATLWMRNCQQKVGHARFDVVSVLWPDDNSPPIIEHIRDAFPAAD